MKKLLCISLAVFLLFSMAAACGKNSAASQTTTAATTTEPAGGFIENVFGDDISVTTTAPKGTESTTATQPQQETTTQPTQGQTSGSQATTQTPSAEEPKPPEEDPSATLAKEYEAYEKMSANEKKAWREATFKNESGKFDSDAFFAWHEDALAAYKAANPPTPIPPDGNINLG